MKILLPANRQYDQDVKEYAVSQTVIVCEDESLTVQDEDGSTDLNILLKRMGVNDGSVLPATLGITDPAYYGDFTDAPDLKTALDRIHEAEERFMMLPPQLRERFHNNALEMLQWVQDPRNIDEAIKLKMLIRRAPDGAPVSDPPTGGNSSEAEPTKPEG